MGGLEEIFEWLYSLPQENQKHLIQWVLDNLGDGFTVLDKDLRYVYVNKAVLERGNRQKEDFIGRHMLDVFPDIEDTRYPAYLQVLETGKPIRFEVAVSEIENLYLNILAFKIYDGLGILTKDLTRDIAFENTIMELHRHAEQLQHTDTLEQVYDITIDVMNRVLGYGNYDILIHEGDRLMQAASKNLPIGEGVPMDSNGVTIRAFKQKKTIRIDDLQKDDGYYLMVNPETGKHFEQYPLSRSELAAPIMVDDKPIGVLNVENPMPNAFNDRDALFLEILAIHIAGAIKRLKDLNQLRVEESKFTQYADNAGDAIWIYTYGEGYNYLNPAVERLFGYSEDEVRNDPYFTLNHVIPEDKQKVLQIDEAVHSGTLESSRNILRFITSNGSIIHVEQWIYPMKDGEGNIIGIYGASRDVTQEITLRDNLRALNEHASKLGNVNTFEEIADITLDILKNILHCEFASFQINENKSLRTIHTIGFPSRGWILPLDGPGVTVQAAKEQRSIIIDDSRKANTFLGAERKTRSELAVPVLIGDESVAVINIEDENINYYTHEDQQFVELLAQHVASAMERIRTREEYLKTQEQLIEEQIKLERVQEMDEIKTRFISTATHEIRTPLTSIKGYTEILSGLLSDTDDPKILEYFHTITRNLERLEHLTNDLLDVQRIDSGRMSIDIQPTDINELVDDVHLEVLPLINEKNQVIEIKPRLKTSQLRMDRMRIHQVLINLITNASRYSPPDTKTTLDITETQNHVTFKVTDRGRGIEPENLPKLFKPFPDIIYHDTQRGTGLGLAICKGIIELHHGTIKAESEGYGKGSVFTFTLPKN